MKVLTEKEIDDVRAEERAKALREAAELRDGLESFVRAWESLPGNRSYSPTDIQKWVCGVMYDAVQKARSILANEPQPSCPWTEYPEGYWSTSCGRSWTFIEGGPRENGICYCHGCGKPVRIADEPTEKEE